MLSGMFWKCLLDVRGGVLDELAMFSGCAGDAFWMLWGCFLNDLVMFSGCFGVFSK